MAESANKRNSSARSSLYTFADKKSSSRSPLFGKRVVTVPPCILDEQHPKLRRSVSERVKPRSSSVIRSLWSAENREYLEMRFKVQLPDQMGDDRKPNASASETSSIFSNADCSSSLSSGSDASSVKEPGFLDFELEQGNLVESDQPKQRHRESEAEGPGRRIIRPSEDRYPVWASPGSGSGTSWRLLQSYKERIVMNSHVARRLLTSSPSYNQNRSPQKDEFTTPISISEQLRTPDSESSHDSSRSSQRLSPEVHCRSFFLKKPWKRSGTVSAPTAVSTPVDKFQTAHLHCAVRHDHYSYTFVIDGCEELLVARVPRTKHEQQDGQEQVCSFYSWKQRRRLRSRTWRPTWASTDTPDLSELVASMSLSKRLNTPDTLHLEFVLLSTSSSETSTDDDPARLSFSLWEAGKSPTQKRNWWTEVVRPISKSQWIPSSPGNSAFRRKPRSLSNSSSPSRGKIDEDLDILQDVWKQMESLGASKASHEVAAVIVTVPLNPFGFQRARSSSSFERVNVTVVLPDGEHGMPKKGITGPSPLIERYRYGHCDCGSWDMGCNLHILRRRSAEPHSGLTDVSLRGTGKQDEDVFSFVGLSNGLFSVKFKEPMSALQAFATAVAILYRKSTSDVDPHRKASSTVPLQDLVDAARMNAPQSWSKVLGLPSVSTAHLERL